MTFYVQYREDGKITATVQSFGKPPNHPRQLIFSEYVKTNRKRVNIDLLELEDIPPRVVPEIPAPVPLDTPPDKSILDKLIDGIF